MTEIFDFLGKPENLDTMKMIKFSRELQAKFGTPKEFRDLDLSLLDLQDFKKTEGEFMKTAAEYQKEFLETQDNLAHLITQTSFDAGLKGEKCPLEKAYTKKEVLSFFTSFSSVNITVEYLFGTGWGIINRFFPQKLHRLLGRVIGWHLLINAVK